MSFGQGIYTVQQSNPSDLDSFLVNSLKESSNSLMGLDRILDRTYAPYDVKGRAQAVARLTAVVAYNLLSRDYDREITQLENRIIHLFANSHDGLNSEKQLLTSTINHMKIKYERLSKDINSLYATVPHSEIREKTGQELNSILLKDSMSKLPGADKG
jgi:hypothetical protein